MLRAYVVGARVAFATGPLTLGLWLAGALFGFAFAGAASYWLGSALDGSLATNRLLKDLDPHVLIDLWHYHQTGAQVLLLLGGVLAVVFVLLWLWFHGAILTTVCRAGALAPVAALRDGLELTPVLAGLLTLAVSALALFSAAVGGATWWLIDATRASPSAMISYYIAGTGLVLWLVGMVLLTAVHDHARLRAAVTDVGPLTAYGWALRFVLRGGERAFALALLLQATGVLIWAVYQTLGMGLPVTGGLGVTGSFIWAELFLLARVGLRVWAFAAQRELQASAWPVVVPSVEETPRVPAGAISQ